MDEIKAIDIDVICDSNLYHNAIPIFNETSLQILNESKFFNVKNVALSHIPENIFKQVDVSHFENSKSRVIISRGICQHMTEIPWEIFDKYDCKISIIDEPLFKYCFSKGTSEERHLDFIEKVKPDILCYPSKIDALKSPVKNTLYWDNGISEICKNKKKTEPHLKKSNALYCGTALTSYKQRGEGFELCKKIFGKNLLHYQKREYDFLCGEVSKNVFQIQLSHNILIHNLRLLQTWFMGSIPIIVGWDNWMEDEDLIYCYKDILDLNFKNCILTDVSKAEKDLELIKDQSFVNEMLSNIEKMDLSKYCHQNTLHNLYNKINNLK